MLTLLAGGGQYRLVSGSFSFFAEQTVPVLKFSDHGINVLNHGGRSKSETVTILKLLLKPFFFLMLSLSQ